MYNDNKYTVLVQVNNAGILLQKNSIEFSAEDISTLFGTNFESGFHFSQLSHSLFKNSGNGSIVFISSIAGATAISACSIYGATKGIYQLLIKTIFIHLFSPTNCPLSLFSKIGIYIFF